MADLFKFQLSAFQCFSFSLPMHPGYFPVLFWSLLILVSFWGYGEALRRVINRREFDDLGWGLTMAWGMAVVLALGGVLMALHLAKAPALTALVLFGVCFSLSFLMDRLKWPLAKKRKKYRGSSRHDSDKVPVPFSFASFSFAVLYILSFLILASSIAWPHQLDPNDDLICYLMVPEKILQTGTLIEPFNFRRAGSLGGHWFLQSLVMIVGGDRSGHVVDSGIARVMLIGLALGMPCGGGKWSGIQRWLLALIALIYPIPRINTMSALTGSVGLLGLVLTIWRIHRGTSVQKGFQCWVPASMLAASTALMRPNFSLAAAGFLAAGFLCTGIKERKQIDWLLALRIAALTVILIAPWSWVLFVSSGTPFIPPFKGNLQSDFLHTSLPFAEYPKVLLGCMVRPEVLPLILTIFLGIILRISLFNCAISVISIGVAMAFCQIMSATSITEMPRYLVPILIPSALFTAGVIQGQPLRTFAPIAVIAIFMFGGNSENLFVENRERILGLPAQLQTKSSLHPDSPSRPGSYVEGVRGLQDLVPKGEKILSITDFPYVVDFSRNPVFSIDCIGVSAPSGGFPFFAGSEALNKYLAEQNIRYLLCVDFNNALLLYNRNYWKNHPRGEWYFRAIWAPRFLDFMDNVDSLSDWGRVLGRFENIRLIELPPPSHSQKQ